jgi:dipeptidyl aminopeptidase/acylaminoacyl peptidase
MRHRRPVLCLVIRLALLLAVAAALPVAAADVPYKTPPRVVVDILDAPPPPQVLLAPSGEVVLVIERRGMPPIAELARPMLRLAGHRIDPRTSGPHRGFDGIRLTLTRVADGAERPIGLPDGLRFDPVGFSPDGRSLAVLAFADDRIELWLVDVETAVPARVEGLRVNAAIESNPCSWLDDGSGLVCLAVPAGRGPEPAAPAVPTGPNVQESAGKAAPVPTYQDLLETAHDEALFEHYGTSQVVFVDRQRRAAVPAGTPGLYASAAASPDGRFLLVERLVRPFSRLVPSGDFPRDIEIWTRTGERIHTVAHVPSGETVPINGVVTGPREARWDAKQPATVVWVEALDGGDPKAKVAHRDRLMAAAAPFTGEPRELLRLEWRFRDVRWTDRGRALVTEYDRPKRWTRTWMLAEGAAPAKIFDHSAEDAYQDPGRPLPRPGTALVLQQGESVFLAGQGASPEGERPFLDRFDLQTRKAERLFRSPDGTYESVVGLVGDDGQRILTRAESPASPPNFQVRDLRSGRVQALTRYADPAPALRGVTKQLLTYQRADGVQLSATLYLPPGYRPGTRLPVLVWAYPREFTDPAAAGRVTGSPHRFTLVQGASHMLLLTQGYAILDGPTMPIVGPGETANDTYVEQLVASAKAAVDTIVGMGVADPDRIAVGGHSYGAFMTANLLAHSDLFRAGIARSGAYNRTLTPFGFQNERRTFWEVPEIYARMSPFFHAPKVNEPILLIHGEADNNSGTFPIQSERFYMALKGHGATVRYVTLPYESHGYAARESVLHVVAEMIEWCDRWLKGARPGTAPTGGRP